MKNLIASATALLLLSAAPALAMSCCGGSKGKGAMMCGKGRMAMNHAQKGKKGGCCCEGMSGGNMSKRT
ncbi:hypothetical protein [Methylorubrum extorquens]